MGACCTSDQVIRDGEGEVLGSARPYQSARQMDSLRQKGIARGGVSKIILQGIEGVKTRAFDAVEIMKIIRIQAMARGFLIRRH